MSIKRRLFMAGCKDMNQIEAESSPAWRLERFGNPNMKLVVVDKLDLSIYTETITFSGIKKKALEDIIGHPAKNGVGKEVGLVFGPVKIWFYSTEEPNEMDYMYLDKSTGKIYILAEEK